MAIRIGNVVGIVVEGFARPALVTKVLPTKDKRPEPALHLVVVVREGQPVVLPAVPYGEGNPHWRYAGPEVMVRGPIVEGL